MLLRLARYLISDHSIVCQTKKNKIASKYSVDIGGYATVEERKKIMQTARIVGYQKKLKKKQANFRKKTEV